MQAINLEKEKKKREGKELTAKQPSVARPCHYERQGKRGI